MHRHSLFFKLNILFTIALLATLMAAFSMALHVIKKDQMELLFKSRLLIKEIRMTGDVPYGLLKEFDLKLVENAKKREVLHNAKRRAHVLPFEPKYLHKKSEILIYKGHRYLHLKLKRMDLLLEDKQTFFGRFSTPLLVLLGILFLLITMYMLLRRSLLPLKKLERDMMHYGEGVLNEYQYTDKKDEVSLVSNAFLHSAQKTQRLQRSRELFVRNLFHELNTPVTKGKILAEIVEEPTTKTMLSSIFTRLSSLLKELAKMEQLISENYSLQKKPIRIKELIDEASDLLYLENKIDTNVKDEVIVGDFSTMSIVFKNLIDNALKYGTHVQVLTDKSSIQFINEGKKLSESLEYYTEAFSKGIEIENQQGFGLGLYVVNEILKKHGMDFSYTYKRGKNIFIITYGNNNKIDLLPID